ncbi:MAG: HEPN domain-containing protein [Bacillota bacterium]|jgi:HEPN domain-containing protein|nr:HEPN domain-containing protein [Bacillota bacterium]HOB92386.1 HEPN domain-containing protein [Bacillota bacterium]HPZ55492.1 HEPN domain-containing protein [Bacillota bacterium]HQD18963.1 HEPN domain-containing protein [Bacillota bacterium]
MRDKPWSQWLRRAESNLARAKLGRQAPEILYEDLCFDAQQAAEKSLKALMLYLGMRAPRTHSIGYLLKLLRDSRRIQVPDELREAAILTDYAVETRYPGDWEPVNEDDYRHAVLLAERVYQWVLSVAR